MRLKVSCGFPVALIENGQEIVGGVIVLSVTHWVRDQESVYQVVSSVMRRKVDIVVKGGRREMQGSDAARRGVGLWGI